MMDSTTTSPPPESSPEAPAKTKKPTPTQLKAELEDLRASALKSRQQLTKAEVTLQQVRTAVKSDGQPGLTMNQDHYRLKQQIDAVRKILGVEGEIDG